MCWARFTRGVRKEGTAFATASTPVRAEQPEAKALSSNRAPTVVALPASAEACPAAAAVLAGASRNSPTTMIAMMESTNTAVGTMNQRADSAIPRRLIAVTRTSTPRQSQTRSPYRLGTAEVSAATPAVTETATFRM